MKLKTIIVLNKNNFIKLIEIKNKKIEKINISNSGEVSFGTILLACVHSTNQKFCFLKNAKGEHIFGTNNFGKNLNVGDMVFVQICKENFNHKRHKASTLIQVKGNYDNVEEAEYESSIVCIKYGAGGEDSKDLAKIMSDLYSKAFYSDVWYEDCSFFFRIKDKNEANKFFISECGIHKIIRLSPFTNKRQTSFISVRLIRIPKKIQENINEKDIKVECFRSSGKGGQHANKTESAIRLTHVKTGITVKIESTRSQGQNKVLAMDIIYAKIQEKKSNEIRDKSVKKMKSEDKANWGSTPTKTWCLYPDQYIKYHDNGLKIRNFGNIFDINIKNIINLNIEHKLFGTTLD